MADQNCSSPSSTAPVIITSTSENIRDDKDGNSPTSENLVGVNNCPSEENSSFCSPPAQAKSKPLFSDSTISSSSEKRNGVSGANENNSRENMVSFLRPSVLSSGFSSFSSTSINSSKGDVTFSLKSPKLTLPASKFGDASFTSTDKNAFSLVSSGSEKNETSSNLWCAGKNNTAFNAEEKASKPEVKSFSSNLKIASTTPVSLGLNTSAITLPNFIFGQNLHERVTDSFKSANAKENTDFTNKSNGTSDMLFTSVLTGKEVAVNINNEKNSQPKDSSSLIEDAARCQEARANKRKFEEVAVTTGEEGEENVLQVNVKLFAFDNGSWIERGRGILRLNDKLCDDSTTSRIVIRTLGSLRVVLNTKIWSGMSLSRASERSARFTAIDPNGQVKIFLIQASLKDMSHLYPLIDYRIKLCKEQEQEAEESPKKKKALEKDNKI